MQEQKWNLKDKRGRIFGPFSTTKIMELIRKGALDGEEQLSPINSDRWIEISKYPEFYDVVLDALSIGKKELSQAEIQNALEKKDSNSEDQEASKPKKRGRVVEEKVTVQQQGPPPPKKEEPVNPAPVYEESIIDLKPRTQIKKKEDKKFFILIAGVLVVLLGAGLFYDYETSSLPTSEKIHLIYPKLKKSPLQLAEAQRAMQRALSEFQKDTFEGYYRTQNNLVSILESNPKTTDAISLLCLTYRELWPFAYKDSQDLQSLTAIVQLAQKENSSDVHGATCRAVQALLVGNDKTATDTVQSVLDGFPTAAVFYEMKADLLYKEGQKNTAISYLQKTENLWPKWVKAFFKEAQIRSDIQDYSNAVRMFKNILDTNPDHDKSRVEMGIIELTHFTNQRGLDLLQVGLKNEKIPSEIKVRGNFALANYYLKSDPSEALKYAQKAYAFDPKNMALRNTILSLGGESALSAVKSQDAQLMVIGDNYFRNKSYLAAQAEYKTAFEVNPKNALAALRASESLWNMNQTENAIQWAKKSVAADPKFIEGYVKLADYHSQKYDFKAAADNLVRAQQEGKTNYLVFRGYAQLELRRQNLDNAVKRAEQALKLYDSDVESLVILAQSYLQLRQFDKGFQYSSKATQLDSNNIKAHEAYAESLLGMRGVTPAAAYLNDKVSTFPGQVEYRVALGSLYLKDERFNDAVGTLEQAVEFEPSSFRGHMLLGKAYQQQAQTNSAIKSFLKAAALDPTNAEPLFELGNVYMKDAKTQSKALKNYQGVININPRYPRAHYMAGQAALALGNKREAAKYADLEKKMNPSLADSYILSADVYFSESNYSKAATELRRAVQLRPKDSQLYVQLAKCYRLVGQLDVASSMLRAATSVESGNAEIYKEQGLVFEKQGLNDLAIASFNRYLEIRPNAEDRGTIQSKISVLGGM